MNIFARFFIGFVFLLATTSVLAADPRVVLRKPLIVGASVSSGLVTTGPGTRAALHYTSPGNIENTAVSGAEGLSTNWWTVKYVARHSVVIGIDWMFWDTVHSDISASIAVLKRNLAIARAARVPVILGDVPRMDLFFYRQINRDRMNGAIHSLCKVSQGCYVLPFARTYEGLRAGYRIRYRNADYDWPHLSSDGLHLNSEGSECLADMIVALIRRM